MNTECRQAHEHSLAPEQFVNPLTLLCLHPRGHFFARTFRTFGIGLSCTSPAFPIQQLISQESNLYWRGKWKYPW